MNVLAGGFLVSVFGLIHNSFKPKKDNTGAVNPSLDNAELCYRALKMRILKSKEEELDRLTDEVIDFQLRFRPIVRVDEHFLELMKLLHYKGIELSGNR